MRNVRSKYAKILILYMINKYTTILSIKEKYKFKGDYFKHSKKYI